MGWCGSKEEPDDEEYSQSENGQPWSPYGGSFRSGGSSSSGGSVYSGESVFSTGLPDWRGPTMSLSSPIYPPPVIYVQAPPTAHRPLGHSPRSMYEPRDEHWKYAQSAYSISEPRSPRGYVPRIVSGQSIGSSIGTRVSTGWRSAAFLDPKTLKAKRQLQYRRGQEEENKRFRDYWRRQQVAQPVHNSMYSPYSQHSAAYCP